MNFESLSIPGAPSVVTPPPGPASRAILELQARLESRAVSYPRGLPMAIRRGRGATVEDVDGNVFLDFFAGAGVLNLGHANPDVLAAARAQLEEVTHTLDIPTPARVSMVEALREILPEELGKLFFGGPTGSDAVEAAVKLAKYNTKRAPVLAFQGSYHGMTSGPCPSAAGLHSRRNSFPCWVRSTSPPSPTVTGVRSAGPRRRAPWSARLTLSTFWRTPTRGWLLRQRSWWSPSRGREGPSFQRTDSFRECGRPANGTGWS
jgi:diaminobutyrate-2-oxoglutarate transaminase